MSAIISRFAAIVNPLTSRARLRFLYIAMKLLECYTFWLNRISGG
jgi:hypothetical protein